MRAVRSVRPMQSMIGVILCALTLANCAILKKVGVVNDRGNEYQQEQSLPSNLALVAEGDGQFGNLFDPPGVSNQTFKPLARPELSFIPEPAAGQSLFSRSRQNQKVQLGRRADDKLMLQSIASLVDLKAVLVAFLGVEATAMSNNGNTLLLESSKTMLLLEQRVGYSYLTIVDLGAWSEARASTWLSAFQDELLKRE